MRVPGLAARIVAGAVWLAGAPVAGYAQAAAAEAASGKGVDPAAVSTVRVYAASIW